MEMKCFGDCEVIKECPTLVIQMPYYRKCVVYPGNEEIEYEGIFHQWSIEEGHLVAIIEDCTGRVYAEDSCDIVFIDDLAMDILGKDDSLRGNA